METAKLGRKITGFGSHFGFLRRAEPTYLQIYRCHVFDNEGYAYIIVAGPKNELQKLGPSAATSDSYWTGIYSGKNKTEIIRAVPPVWKDDVNDHIRLRNQGSPCVALVGILEYEVLSGTAYSTSYFPKAKMEDGIARGLPYFIEAIVVSDLKHLGIAKVHTGELASLERIKQVKRVGLRHMESVDMDIWLKGLGRGIRESAQAQRMRNGN